jgi:sterol desaturase/sphingolipid hydroxylase (fatty acid hydroxylase superfamily)
MFASPLLDRFTRVHPVVVPVLFVPVIAVFGALALGEAGIGARLHWMIHGVHHDHPNDPMRLVMPPSASVPLGVAFALLFQAVLAFGPACAVSAGFFLGYLAYDMTHFYVHHRRPRTWVGRKLRELHMRHHFQDHNAGFGVSAPWWDVVFGTAPRSKRP